MKPKIHPDTKRLDWIEKQLPPGFDWALWPLDWGGFNVAPVRWGFSRVRYKTARAAIDRGMHKKAKKAKRVLPRECQEDITLPCLTHAGLHNSGASA
jgi:hypothetical protein